MSDQLKHDVTHFDVFGDLHGCYYELLELVEALGYVEGDDGLYTHPEGRMLVSVGDVTDRGWYNSQCLQFVFNHWKAGKLLWCQGNHDNKLFRWMKGNPVSIAHGLERTVQELEQAWPFEMERAEFGQYLLDAVPTKIELDGGNVVVVHAFNGKEKLRMFGKRAGPDNARVDWWHDYQGPEFVVFGHYWNNDLAVYDYHCCVDSSCCKGGSLAALQWPERDVVEVQAHKLYCED